MQVGCQFCHKSGNKKHLVVGPIRENEVVKESDNHLLVFDLPNSDEEEEFVGAELRILTLVEIKSDVISGVERQLKVSIYDDATKTFYSLEEVRIYHLNNTWLSFNVTKPVVEVLRKSGREKYLKIVISVSAFLPYYENPGGDFRLSLMPVRDDFDHDYPILLLSYSSSRRNSSGESGTRTKRSIEEDYEEETNRVWDDDNAKKTQVKKIRRNTCRRKPLYIDFTEINFDMWIVQPRGYEVRTWVVKMFGLIVAFRRTNAKASVFIQWLNISTPRNTLSFKLFSTASRLPRFRGPAASQQT